MSNVTDRTTVELFVNGEQAEKAMERLRKKADDLAKAIDDAKANGDLKEAAKLQRELDKVNKELNRTESVAKGTGIVLNNLSNTSIHGLKNALKYLRKEISMTKPNTEQWQEYAEQIQAVEERIKELNEEMKGGQSLWEKYSEWSVKAWPALDLIRQGYDSVISSLREYVDAYASMDQEMANVRKFTGLTEEQVAELNEEFKKMDTRTSREDLNKLAQEAGRLGKTSTEDILGFVAAADKINVALDDLGDGATLTLSKLTGIFGVEAQYGTEQSLLKVGSVINELSQNCAASAPYITEFASRMGGVGAQANMSIPQLMAFGAVLDSNEQQVEASATALSQVIVRMMQEPAKYAQVAGLDVKQFSDMLKTDVNGALVMFLETLNKAGGMDVLSPMFKDMGENGSRAISALSTLATHIDEVKAQQEAANQAFAEGVSIDNEFAVQNETVEASLEKCKNAANDLKVELGERLYPLMSHLLTSSSAIIRALSITVDFVFKHKGAVMALVAAISGYIAVRKVQMLLDQKDNIIKKVKTTLIALETKATTSLAVVTEGMRLVYYRLTGQVTKAMAAQRAYNAAMAATPWGAILTAVSAALIAFQLFDDELDESAEKMDTLNKSKEEAAAKLKEEKTLLEQNILTIENFNGTRDEERILIDKLNEKYGGFFGTYNTLNEWYKVLTQSGADYCNSIYQQMLLEAKHQQALDLAKKADVYREKGLKGEGIINGDILWQFTKDIFTADSFEDVFSWNAARKKVYRKNKKEYDAIADAYDNLADGMMQEYAKEVAEQKPFTAPENSITPLKTPQDTPQKTPRQTASTKTGDKFAAEKKAREDAINMARIAYAEGETDYAEYTKRMDEIDIDYYEKLLERTDLSNSERLSIEAQCWEAMKKGSAHITEQVLREENAGYEKSLYYLNESYAKKLEAGNLSAQEREQLEATHRESVELLELEHLRKLVDMYEEGSDERLKAEKRYQDARIAAQQRHQQEYEKKEAEYASVKEKFFGDNPQEKQQKYDKAFEALKVVYDRELKLAGDNAEEKLRIEEAFLKAQDALRKEYGLVAEEDTRSSMQKAVDASVEWLNGDGGKAMTGTLSTLASGMSSIFSGLSTMMQAELEIQTAAINKKYDREIELAQGNSYKVAKLEKQKEKEIAKAKNAANKKMFTMQVIQAVAQTAQNAINAYGSAAAIPVVGHVLAPVAAAMAVAAGAIQIAAIKKQQQAAAAEGYSKGGFTRKGPVDEPAGIVHAGEWVASQRLLASPVARPMIEALDQAQRTNTIGSLKADDVSRSITAGTSLVRMAETDNGSALLVAAAMRLSASAENMTSRLNEPFVTVATVTGDRGINKAQDDYTRMMNNVTPKSKRKK